jgi:hypothetical protein
MRVLLTVERCEAGARPCRPLSFRGDLVPRDTIFATPDISPELTVAATLVATTCNHHGAVVYGAWRPRVVVRLSTSGGTRGARARYRRGQPEEPTVRSW